MLEQNWDEYRFESIYRFVDIIQQGVDCDFDFWNFNANEFVQSALKFRKKSLLHIYSASTLYCYYLRRFRKDGDCIQENEIEEWIKIMNAYGIKLTRREYKYENDDASWIWFQKNEKLFLRFFDIIADEIVYILFNDKQFLVKFNHLVRNVMINDNDSYSDYVKWPKKSRNDDGTIKRCAIPQWVKKAVFHRDKGRCVFCNKDLTNTVSLFNQANYDHIIPLKNYGTNDPCNIQLSCEECNKSKGAKEIVPKYKYQKWW